MPGILYLYIFQLNFFTAAFFSDPNVGLFAIFLPISIVVRCCLQAGTGIAELIALEISRQVLLHFLLVFSAVSSLFYTRLDSLTISKCADESSYRGVPQENLAC